jgi:uncharacterized protein (DUF1697 family)
MPRYVAFLRGVTPMNLMMAELKRCLEKAGFTDVKTVLSSGNVAFDSPSASEARLARDIETAMQRWLKRRFATVVRSSIKLRKLLESDPYASHRLPSDAKRVVTFLRKPQTVKIALPLESDGAKILAIDRCEAFSAYVPSPKGPVFMTLIEKTFGKDVTTRTWDTVRKCAKA